MSNSDYLPKEDAQLQLWLQNYTALCQSYATALGLSTTEIAVLVTKVSTYSDALGFSDAAKKAASGAVTAKNTAKSDVAALVRAYTREFKANPTVSEALLDELGVVNPTVTVPPTTVTGLKVNGCDDGVNSLKWNRGTNSSNTIFIIEYRTPDVATWSIIAAISKTSYNHMDQVPGETAMYRVTATRSGLSSAPCPPVYAYGNTAPGDISLAA